MIEVVESCFVSLPQSGSQVTTQPPQASWSRQSFERTSLVITLHSSTDSDSDSDSDSDLDVDLDQESLDEYISIQRGIKRANDVWNQSYADVPDSSVSSAIKPGIKVNFSSQLTCVQTFEDDEESKSSRLGSWKIDAERFKFRIQSIGQILAPILHPDHRDRIFNSRSTTQYDHQSNLK